MNKRIMINTVIAATLVALSLAGGAQAQDVEVRGFVEGLWAAGLDENNPTGRDYPAAETRLQLRLETYSDNAEAFAKLDFLQDGFDSTRYEWELREAYLKFRLPGDIDLKVGRQILTWGTGDLIFINDVFAKDYQSFFIGRQDQYLKAPQTALRAEWYTGLGTFALVGIPDFEPNITPTGDRLSFYNPMMGGIVGQAGYMAPVEPDNKFENGEVAFRYSRSIKGYNLSGYAYRGYYKNPVGVRMLSPTDAQLFFPELSVYGASLRGQVAGGIVWLEGGYYDSREDKDGIDYFIENSSAKGLVGFERQVASDFTGNLQFQAEQMIKYGDYEQSYEGYVAMMQQANPGAPVTPKADELRTLVTSRWTKQLASQTVTLSLFGFYSPSDEDGYLRLAVNYKYTDELGLMLGANVFDGNSPHTEFGQFAQNDNIYLKVNYGF